jgi:ribose transport system permease protein
MNFKEKKLNLRRNCTMSSKQLEAAPRAKFDWRKNIVYRAFAIVFIFFSIFLHDDGFISVSNVLNIFRQTAIISIMAVGMTYVIASGEIDLSVGAITALSSLVTALALQNDLGIFVALIFGVGVGLVVGLVNGLLVTKVRIPSFLVTLGMMEIVRGAAMWITNTSPVPILNDRFNFIFGSGNLGPVPILLIWTVVIVFIGHIIFTKTPFGRYILATGGNEEAARYTGINTDKIRMIALMVSGALAGLAGMLYAGRMQSGRFSFGDGDEMSVIAAVILGGTSLSGGKGSVIGALVGSLIMGIINNGLIIAGLNVSQQMVVKGLIIILAVAFGTPSKK